MERIYIDRADSSGLIDDGRDHRPSLIYERIEAHPWSQDAEFQAGLAFLLRSATSADTPEQWEHQALHARCFYFNSKFHTRVDPTAYIAWRNLLPQSLLTPGIPVFATPLRASVNGDSSSAVSARPAWQTASHPALPPTVPLRSEDSGALSFDEIVRLITSGEPIPGVREIPNVVVAEQDSGSTTTPKRKPWEKVAQRNEVPEGDLLNLGEP